MSKLKDIIELDVPRHVQPQAAGYVAKEVFQSTGHPCNYCNGNGWFWGEDEVGESLKKDCPVCKGSGKLDAVITVEWIPVK